MKLINLTLNTINNTALLDAGIQKISHFVKKINDIFTFPFAYFISYGFYLMFFSSTSLRQEL